LYRGKDSRYGLDLHLSHYEDDASGLAVSLKEHAVKGLEYALDIVISYDQALLIFLRDRVDIAIIGAIFDLIRMILTITSDVTSDFTRGA
jgi:hypothetical protein